MQIYYKEKVKIKDVLIIPPEDNSSKNYLSIANPLKFMMKCCKCHIYDLNSTLPTQLPSFKDAILCKMIVSSSPLPFSILPQYYFE